jgi:hypothetical protein
MPPPPQRAGMRRATLSSSCRAVPLNISKSTYDKERGGRGRAGGGGGGRDRSRERERERERGGRRKEGGMEGGVCVCVIVFVCIRNGNSHADFLKPKS